MTAHLCSRPLERFTAGTTWKLARISRQAGFVVRYPGPIGNPTRICGAAVSGATKEPASPVPYPRVPCLQGLPLSAGGGQTNNFFVVPDFLFLSRVTVTASRCTSSTGPDWNSVWRAGRPNLQRQRQRQRRSRHVSGRTFPFRTILLSSQVFTSRPSETRPTTLL